MLECIPFKGTATESARSQLWDQACKMPAQMFAHRVFFPWVSVSASAEWVCWSLLSRLTEDKMYQVECNPHLRAPRSRFRDRRRPPQRCSWSVSASAWAGGRQNRKTAVGSRCWGPRSLPLSEAKRAGAPGLIPGKTVQCAACQKPLQEQKTPAHSRKTESRTGRGDHVDLRAPTCQLQQSKAGPTVWENVFIFPKCLTIKKSNRGVLPIDSYILHFTRFPTLCSHHPRTKEPSFYRWRNRFRGKWDLHNFRSITQAQVVCLWVTDLRECGRPTSFLLLVTPIKCLHPLSRPGVLLRNTPWVWLPTSLSGKELSGAPLLKSISHSTNLTLLGPWETGLPGNIQDTLLSVPANCPVVEVV